MLRGAILGLAALALSGCALLGGEPPVDGGWRLVYAANAEGRTLAGDKRLLMRAVRAGLPLRVGWGIRWTLADGRPGGIEHVADAGFVSIYQGEVFAQVTNFLQQRPDPARADIALGSDARFVVMLDTTGRARHAMHPSGETRDERVSTYWYVPWRSHQGPAALDVPDELY